MGAELIFITIVFIVLGFTSIWLVYNILDKKIGILEKPLTRSYEDNSVDDSNEFDPRVFKILLDRMEKLQYDMFKAETDIEYITHRFDNLNEIKAKKVADKITELKNELEKLE